MNNQEFTVESEGGTFVFAAVLHTTHVYATDVHNK
jgi:hypothetical protein